MKKNSIYPFKRKRYLVLMYVIFIIISILIFQIQKRKVINRSDRFYGEYPFLSLDDSINSKILRIHFSEGNKVYPEIRQVELLNGEQRTIFAKSTKDGVSLGNMLEVGSYIYKESNRDSLTIQNIIGSDTLTYYRVKLFFPN